MSKGLYYKTQGKSRDFLGAESLGRRWLREVELQLETKGVSLKLGANQTKQPA